MTLDAYHDDTARLREDERLFGKRIPLNSEFFIIREAPGVLSFNTVEMRDPPLTFAEHIPLFFDAARTLGKMLTTEEYRDITRITATSWLGTLNPEAIELMGFHIDKETDIEKQDVIGQMLKTKYREEVDRGLYRVRPEHHDIEPAFASMGREEFLERYGPHPKVEENKI